MQDSVSDASPVHDAPPFASSVVLVRVFVRIPLLQVWLQLPQAPQVPHSQFTVGIMKYKVQSFHISHAIN